MRSAVAAGRLVRRHPLLAIGVLALVARAAYVIARPSVFVFADSYEYDVMARGLLAGQGLLNETGFVRPPLYALFVAACYAVGGAVVLQIAQVVLGSATTVLIAVLARMLYPRPEGAPLAGLMAAVYPWFFQLVGGLASETMFTFLATAAFTLILLAVRRGTLVLALCSGAAFAMAALTRSNILVLAPVVAVWLWLRAWIGLALLFAASLTLVLVPYTAYNVARGEGLVVASSGSGEEFFIANNRDTARAYDPAISDDEWRALNDAIIGPRALADLGCPAGLPDCFERIPPAERDRFFYGAGLEYILSRPGEWALLSARKVVHYWRPWADPRAYPLPLVVLSGVSFAAVLALSIVGLRRLRPGTAALIVSVAIALTITSVLWHFQLRYRYALLDPLLLAAAGPPLHAFGASALARARRSADP